MAGVLAVLDEVVDFVDDVVSGTQQLVSLGTSVLTDRVEETARRVAAKVTSILNSTLKPLGDGIERAIRLVVNAVTDTVRRAEDGLFKVVDWIQNALGEVGANMADALKGVTTTLAGSLSNVATKVERGIAGVAAQVGKTLEGVGGVMADAVAESAKVVTDGIGSLVEGVEELSGSIVGAVTEAVGPLVTRTVDVVTDITTKVVGEMSALTEGALGTLSGLLERLADVLPEVLPDIATGVMDIAKLALPGLGMLDVGKKLWEQYGSEMTGSFEPLVAALQAKAEAFLGDADHPAGLDVLRVFHASPLLPVVAMAIAVFAMPAIGAVVSSALTPEMAWVTQRAYQKLPTLSLPPDVVLRQIIRERMDADSGRGELRLLGYNDDRAEQLLSSQEELLGVGELLDLWRRGVGNDASLEEGLQHRGYGPEAIEAFKELGFINLSAQDIIRLAVREAFTPEVRSRFQLDADFPGDPRFEKAVKAAGLRPEQMRDLWAAHWELPSVQMAFEMLHRGVIEEADLDLLLKTSDVMLFWRDKIKAISFRVLTRVDVRRMHKMGVLTREEVFRSYLDQGYDEVNAERMTLFTERINAPAEKEEELRDLTRSEILQLFRDALITREEAIAGLEAARFDPDAAELFVLREELALDRKVVAREIELVRARFLAREIDYNGAVTALDGLGVGAGQRDAILTDLEIEKARLVRLPSRSEAERMAGKGVITREEYTSILTALGYAPRWVEGFSALLPESDEEKARSLSKTDILRLLREGVLSEAEAGFRLEDSGFAPKDAALLVGREVISALKAIDRQRSLGQADVLSLFRHGLLNRSDAAARLVELTFDAEDVELLLKLAERAMVNEKEAQERRVAAQTKEEILRVRELTKADVLGLFKAFVLDRASTLERLTDAGFVEADAVLLIRRVEIGMEPEEA